MKFKIRSHHKAIIFSHHTKIFYALATVFILYAFYAYYASHKLSIAPIAIHASLNKISETVSVSGVVTPAIEASISFEENGVISNVNVEVGQKVKARQSLIQIADRNRNASYNEAYSQVLKERAALAILEKGATEAELSQKRTDLSAVISESKLSELQTKETVRSLYQSASEILSSKLSPLFTTSNSNYKISFVSCDESLVRSIEIDRNEITTASKDETLAAAEIYLRSIDNLLVKLNQSLSLQCISSDSAFDKYRSVVSEARSRISQSLQELNSKKIKLLEYTNAIEKSRQSLALLSSSADPLRIDMQKALLLQAEARLEQVVSEQSKSYIISPFDAIVTTVDVKLGENITANKQVLSLMADSNFQIEAKLAEVDVAKVSVGNIASITLDAFGKERTYLGTVTRVDPKAYSDGGVSRYKTIIVFNQKYPEIKPGMSANIEIQTKTIANALTLPAKYIQVKSGKALVSVQNTNGDIIEKNIKLGIRSNDGLVQIVEGVNSDDMFLPRESSQK